MATKLKAVGSFFLNNWKLKLLAFILGALSFYAIRGATSFEVPYNVPLEVVVEKGIAILDQDPKTVQVTFRGSQEDLRHLDQRNIRAVVEPQVVEQFVAARVPVEPRNIEGYRAVRVVSVDPGVVNLTFDREAEKRVPVLQPKTIGTPLTGKAELTYDPKFVTIRGPRRRLKDKESVMTEPVDVDGRVESFTKQVRVLPPGDTWVSHIEPAVITVRVNIITESVSREWEGIPIMALASPTNMPSVHFDPPRVTVSLQGRLEVLEQITANSFQVFVDCAGLDGASSQERPVTVHLPASVDAQVTAAVQPDTVLVTFSNAPAVAAGAVPAAPAAGAQRDEQR